MYRRGQLLSHHLVRVELVLLTGSLWERQGCSCRPGLGHAPGRGGEGREQQPRSGGRVGSAEAIGLLWQLPRTSGSCAGCCCPCKCCSPAVPRVQTCCLGLSALPAQRPPAAWSWACSRHCLPGSSRLLQVSAWDRVVHAVELSQEVTWEGGSGSGEVRTSPFGRSEL